MPIPNSKKYLHEESKSAKDYYYLVRNHLKAIILISSLVTILAIVYAYLAKNIYKSTVTVRIVQQNQSVLKNSPDILDTELLDRFIATEIGVIGNYNTREKIAFALIDTFDIAIDKSVFDVIKSKKNEGINGHKSVDYLTSVLSDVIKAEQTPGTDAVEISAESGSPYEAALMANTCAIEYQKLNLAANREKLTNIRKFLEKQNQEKLDELHAAEDTLMKVQEKSGIISVNVQSEGLINQLSDLDAQKQSTKIELMTSNEVLKQYKFFLEKQNPQLVGYLENQSSQAYISALQQQLAELQVNRDLALSMKSPNLDVSAKLKDYNQRIDELQQKLNDAIKSIHTDALSGNPDQINELAQRMVEEEIKNTTLSIRYNQLDDLTNKYEQNLKKLPQTSTELSQFQRNREILQQSYILVNEKYQEAVINELSQSGNVFIVSPGKMPDTPEKPNRKLIVIFGLLLGSCLGFFYVLVRDYFDDTIKSPEDIEKNKISLLSWVPQLNSRQTNSDIKNEFISLYEVDSPISESFKTIKTRLQYLYPDLDNSKVILVTSPAEHEGKTFVSLNLAGSFAQSNKRTLIIDCDLRRPRMHTILEFDRRPGLSDYLSDHAKLEEIIREIKPNSLSFIASGSIPTNPVPLLESDLMKNFLENIREFFDIIIIDSPPIVAVVDSEILANVVDGTVLVLSADKTETRLMLEAIELLNSKKSKFFGTILNNFKDKSGYGYYYKYHYNYGKSNKKKPSFRLKK